MSSISDFFQLFEPFGEIESVEIGKDKDSGKPNGFVFVQYANSEDAKAVSDSKVLLKF